MEYVGQYTVTARAHTRPYARIITINNEIAKQYPNTSIEISEGSTAVGCSSILDLIFSQVGTHVGDEVRITVRGDYDERTLEGIADRVGSVFSTIEVMDEGAAPRSMMFGIRRK